MSPSPLPGPVAGPPRHVGEAMTTVVAHGAEAAGYRHLDLDAPDAILDCAPGQFFHLLCPVGAAHQPFLRRPMSIYGYDRQAGRLSFLYKIVGSGTAALAALDPGDALDVVGPLGHGFSIADAWSHLLLVARGVGLATLAPLAQQGARLGRQVTALCSARSADHLVSVEHFRALGADVVVVTDADGSSDPAHVREIVDGLVAAGRVDAIYTCGSNRLLKLCQAVASAHGLPGEVALEQQMACGLGMCQCCVRQLRRDGHIVQERVCREGPVFPLDEALEW